MVLFTLSNFAIFVQRQFRENMTKTSTVETVIIWIPQDTDTDSTTLHCSPLSLLGFGGQFLFIYFCEQVFAAIP